MLKASHTSGRDPAGCFLQTLSPNSFDGVLVAAGELTQLPTIVPLLQKFVIEHAASRCGELMDNSLHMVKLKNMLLLSDSRANHRNIRWLRVVATGSHKFRNRK